MNILSVQCDDCGHHIEVPAHETPEAWEERTGRKLQDGDPVFVRFPGVPGVDDKAMWELMPYRYWRLYREHLPVVVASPGAGKPSDDWSPA